MYRIANRQLRTSRSRVLPFGLVLVITSCLAACTSTVKLDATWPEGPHHGAAFTNVLVIGVSPDRNVRCAFERALASKLRSKTVKATASCAAMAVDAVLNREAIEAVVKSISADAVIATRLVAVKAGAKEGGSADSRGGGYYKPVAYGYDAYYGVYGIPVVYGDFETAPSVFSVSGRVELNTDVYETRTATKVYRLDTQAKNLESRGMALAMITPRIAERLRDDGLVR